MENICSELHSNNICCEMYWGTLTSDTNYRTDVWYQRRRSRDDPSIYQLNEQTTKHPINHCTNQPLFTFNTPACSMFEELKNFMQAMKEKMWFVFGWSGVGQNLPDSVRWLKRQRDRWRLMERPGIHKPWPRGQLWLDKREIQMRQ